MKTAVNSFMYDIRTSILPFIFIFNPGLLLIGMSFWWQYALVIVTAIVAMLTFCAATKSYFLTHSKRWESLTLLLIAFTLIRPGYWLDQVYDPFKITHPVALEKIVIEEPSGSNIRLLARGENFSGDQVEKTISLPLGEQVSGQSAEDRLYQHAGLSVEVINNEVFVTNLRFDSPAQQSGIDFDWQILELQTPNERPAKEWFYLPALLLLFLVVVIQLIRASKESKAAPKKPHPSLA